MRPVKLSTVPRLAVLAVVIQLASACGGTGESAAPQSTNPPGSVDGDTDRVDFVTSTSTTTTTTTTTLPPTTTSTTTSTTTTSSTTTSTTTTSSTTTTVAAPSTIRCSFASDALFEPGEASLTPAAITELERIVAGTSDVRRVTVEGHTDHRGTDAENLALGQARADVTAAALIDAGIDENLITAVGAGERDAAQGDPSDGQMAADRRVDVVIEADVPITTTC